MSRLCAKPTCSHDAVRWFDIIAVDQHVVERTGATPSTIALCEQHGERFSVPNGWTWVGLDSALELDAPKATHVAAEPELAEEVEAPEEPEVGPDTPRAPWFVASDSSQSESDEDAPSVGPEDDKGGSSAGGVRTTGSLLHRAFHGPDREADAARARHVEQDEGSRREPRTSREIVDGDDDDVATVRDLASRRASRGSVTSYDVELPFPPVDAEPHVAVS